MLKRIISMLLCICTLMGLLIMPTFAADAVRAGEKATVITNWQVFEKPDISSKVTGYLSAGNVVDVLEAYIDGKGGIDGRWHKISYTNKMLNLSGTGYVEAMFSSSKEAFETEHTVEPEKVSASIYVESPLAGVKPYDKILLPDSGKNDMTIDDYKWTGELDSNGCFKEGVRYTLSVTISLKEEVENKIFSSRSADHMVNGFPPTIKLSNKNRTVTLSFTFTQTTAPEIENENMPKKPESTACTPTKVDSFEVGDYGTMMLLSGGYSIYHEPNSKTMYGSSQNTEATIYVLEAGVDGIDTEATYYAIWNDHHEEINYVNMNDARATFGNFVKKGNDPAREYNELYAEKRAEGRQHINEITCVEADMLYATLAEKPYLKGGDYSTGFLGDDKFKGLYTCTGTVYSTTDIPEPYSIVTATSTYVAKDGYHFSKDVTPPDPRYGDAVFIGGSGSRINNTYSINYIDEKTIELVYHEYVNRAPLSNTPTEAMKDYVERHSIDRGVAVPVIGTSKLSDHILLQGAFLWNYPIDYTNAFEIQPGQIIEIVDWDLTDEIPDINGDWCRVRIGSGLGFVPKSYLTDVVMTDFGKGAPAVYRDSRYEFAGGSGTKEDPYLIETPEQLDAIRKNSAKYFKLIKDIDLSDWGNWIPIGGTPAYGGNGDDVNNTAQFDADSFRGQLDGDGHVISGMTIKINEEKPYMQSEGNMRYFGLMAYMSNGLGNNDAGIRNLGLVNYNIDVTYSAYSKPLYIWAGSFATHALDATVTNCYTAN